VIAREGERLRLTGAVTMDTVPGLLDAGLAHLRAGVRRVDVAGIDDIDSSAVALLLAWRRAVDPLVVEGATEPLAKLARLYGVDGLLGLAPR
jgi:phospholipid transport system transporter-binding protein